METQCPHCKQMYDVDEEALGQIIECPECKTDFLIESVTSPTKDAEQKTKGHKHTVSKKTIAIISIAFVVLIGCVVGYFLFPSRPSKSLAIENRAKVYYWIIEAKFKVSNDDAVKTICKERSKLELKESEKQKIEDSYIAFWCDKDVLSFFTTVFKSLNSKESSLDEKRAEFEQHEKKLQEILDTKHPQNKQILGLTDIIEKEYSPIEEIILKHGYVRSLFLIEQDAKYSEINSEIMFRDVENRLNVLLYNIYLKDSEIEYPDELRAFCNERAKQMISIIQKDDELAIDWAKIILSDEMKEEMETGLKENGTTRHVLYWLDSFGEKQIPPIPYGCRADFYLDSRDVLSFRKDYNDIALYGKKKSKY